MSIAESLVDKATAELQRWSEGAWVECVADSHTKKPIGLPAQQPGAQAVAAYWLGGVGDSSRNGCSDYAWSAAFICWCLRQAQVKLEQFPFSGAHHTYIRWAINNTKSNKSGKLYYGERTGDYALQPGDLIAQWRKAKKTDPDPDITFDHQPDTFYTSHCDIVTKVDKEWVHAIGGNVSDKVSESRFELEDGILKPRKTFICILRLSESD